MTLLICLCLIMWGVKRAIQAYEQAELRKTNPEMFMRQQELEQRERLMKREGTKSVVNVGLEIARLFLKK